MNKARQFCFSLNCRAKEREATPIWSPMELHTVYLEQMHAMCAVLYPARTNIDYFPTNFVVRNGEIFYVDFKCNHYMEEWNFEN